MYLKEIRNIITYLQVKHNGKFQVKIKKFIKYVLCFSSMSGERVKETYYTTKIK